jgi:pyruvate dehydrogenase phosphatase
LRYLKSETVFLAKLDSDLLQGIARKLVKLALQEAAKKREMRYSDLKKIDRGVRRHFHDDITVVVLFLDQTPMSKPSWNKGPTLSLKGGGVSVPSNSLALYTST